MLIKAPVLHYRNSFLPREKELNFFAVNQCYVMLYTCIRGKVNSHNAIKLNQSR